MIRFHFELRFLLAIMTAVGLWSSLTCASPVLTGRQVLFLPEVLEHPDELLYVNKFERLDVIDGVLWRVFSDKQKNQTYKESNFHEQFKLLGFMEPFYVLEVKKDLLRLVKDKGISPDGFLSDKAEDFGWIKSENLLLSRNCLRSGINTKVKVILNQKVFKFNQKPEKLIRAEFKIGYVFKMDQEFLLIGEVYSAPDDPDRTIFGWVHEDNLLRWGDNVALSVDLPLAKNSDSTKQSDIIIYESAYTNSDTYAPLNPSISSVLCKLSNQEKMEGDQERYLPIVYRGFENYRVSFLGPYIFNRYGYSGYVYVQDQDEEHPLLSISYYIDKEELIQLIRFLNVIENATNNNPEQKRNALKEAWVYILRTLDMNITMKAVEKMSLNDLHQLSFKLPLGRSNSLGNITFEGIENNLALPQYKLDHYLLSLNQFRDYLLQRSEELNYYFPGKGLSNHIWIDEKDLP
jgi:hypothetical protein